MIIMKHRNKQSRQNTMTLIFLCSARFPSRVKCDEHNLPGSFYFKGAL